MSIKKILPIAFTLLVFSACKKEEKQVATYPAYFEFTEEGAEEITTGIVKVSIAEGTFIVQNERYYAQKGKQNNTVHYLINTQNNVGSNIISGIFGIREQTGSFSKTGNLTHIDNSINYFGISSYTPQGTNDADFMVYQYREANNTVIPPTRYIEPNFEIGKLVSVNDGYLLVGARINGNDKNVVVMKYTKNLNYKIWEKEFGGAGNEMAMDAVQLCDNNYGILAYTYSKGAGDRDVWFLKIDANGFLKFDSTYGGAGYEEPQKIVSRTGCDIYIVGHSSSFGAPEHDGYVLRINENGSIIWEKTFGTANHDGFNTATHIPGTKTFIAAGRSMQGIGQPEDIFVVCFDEFGNELWQKKYGDPSLTELPEDIVADNEFYYLVCNRLDSKGKYTSVFIKDRLGN